MRPVMTLLNDPGPVPLVVFVGRSTVGPAEVDHTIPRAVIALPPLREALLPVNEAVISVNVTVPVVTAGGGKVVVDVVVVEVEVVGVTLVIGESWL